ncbi:hypothetical protein [Actinacidiphila oryziradicis]|uniref:hypothetical protein n=1 Tax=Actinacidiphila oryziradicis TaxID=2571141 RepID=UPI001FE77B72|nr:hypothetical protein [Actinacidiphila oryziradicis]
MALEAFPPGVRDSLPAVSRLRAELLERGDFDAAVELAKRIREVKAHTEIDGPRWQNGRLVADVRLSLVRGDGEPLVPVERDGRVLLDPDLIDSVPGVPEREVTDPFRQTYGELVVKDRDRQDWWYPEGDLEPAGVAGRRTQPGGRGGPDDHRFRHPGGRKGAGARGPRRVGVRPAARHRPARTAER